MCFEKVLPTVLLAAAFTGCAANGPRYSESVSIQRAVSSTQARVVVYRTKDSMQYGARAAAIKVDGRESGSCEYGGFSVLDMNAGEHVLAVDLWDAPGKCELPVTLAAGKAYYYEVQPRVSNLMAALGGGVLGTMIESAGRQCGGPFSIAPVEETPALTRLSELHETQ